MRYDDVIAGFKPEFGNANHITAVPLIARVKALRERVAKVPPNRKVPQPVLKELDNLENRVVGLLAPDAERLPYKGPAE